MKIGDWQRWVVGGIFFALLPLSSGCIDDNMSDCNNFTVRYRIELSTHTQAFSGRMENLNMHFYDGNKSLAYHEYVERERMPSNNIYAITLPANDYHHFAIANISQASCVKCSDLGVASDRYKLSYESAADTVSSHVSELYVGRERFTIADRNQFIEVVLTPCISKTRLHLSYGTDPVVPVKRVEGYVNETATGFLCNDSLYEYDRPVVVQMNEAGKDENGLALFEAVSFPSRNEASAGAKSLNRNPSEENAIWNTDVYVTIGDKITRNTINLTCNNFTVRYRIELSTHTQAFSGRMENLNMHFYDGNKSLAYHEYVERERMPSNNIYAITLPANDYHHFAIANISQASCVKCSDLGVASDRYKLSYESAADTVSSHVSELYVGRERFTIADRNQFIEVVLTPCISKTRLHLSYGTDPVVPVKRVEGYVNETATGFLCNDSLYEYDRPVVVQMNEAGKDENGLALFEAVSFPSRNEASAGAKSLNRNPSEENAIWNTDVYVTIGDKITRNTINLTEPLPAGECIEIYGVVRDDGSIDIGHNVQATVAVTIDWKPGGDIDVDI